MYSVSYEQIAGAGFFQKEGFFCFCSRNAEWQIVIWITHTHTQNYVKKRRKVSKNFLLHSKVASYTFVGIFQK